jgi:SPP1 family predicted phage head-tail adaptor
MSNVAAGKLRHYMQLESQIQTQDPVSGEIVITWNPEGGWWADIQPSSGREFLAAQATQSEIVGKLVIRQHPRLDPTWRAVYRNQIYNLHALLPDLNSGLEYWTIPYSLGVNDGR